jgi:AcrR family transcriptional regulator
MASATTSEPTVRRRRAAAMSPDARRSAIVEATIPLLLTHGESVTTRQIADAAGIAEGTIFRAFPDKDALIDAALDTALDTETFERALGEIDPALPLEEVVNAAVATSQRRVAEAWRLLSSLGHRLHDGGRRPMAESATLARLLDAHRDELVLNPRAAARALRAITFAMTHPMLVPRPAPPREITRLFLHGAARGPAC